MDINAWEAGKEEEMKFWRQWLVSKGKVYEGHRRLVDKFTPMIGHKKEVIIANLGAGPLSLIGDTRRDVKVKVIPSDLLADKYAKLIEELDLHPVNPVEKQDMTALTYADGAFDIVFCSNAIDHSQDPYKALQEMVRICKPGGWIYLHHIAHEGQRHRYRGLHKWNLDRTEDGDCIIWDNEPGPQTNAFLLSDIYPGFTNTLELIPKAALINSYVQKSHEV